MKSDHMVSVDRKDLEAMVDSLDYAINVCFNVDSQSDDVDRSFPFATGYSRATMQDIKKSISQYLLQDTYAQYQEEDEPTYVVR